MSEDIIRGVFSYAERYRTPIMLIASRNQIDANGGYVFKTYEFAAFISELRRSYPHAKVYLCRDHCGPRFGESSRLRDVYQTIETDLACGFDLIHIDFSAYAENYDATLRETIKALAYIARSAPQVLLEVATLPEQKVPPFRPLSVIERELRCLLETCDLHFYVTPTGSLVRGGRQIGSFEPLHMQAVAAIARQQGVFIKEHNADFLAPVEIKARVGIVDAMNIAPQPGMLQTQLTIAYCRDHHIDAQPFLNLAYASGRWRKWLESETAELSADEASLIAGHYLFRSAEYRRIYDELASRTTFLQALEEQVHQLIDSYIRALSEAERGPTPDPSTGETLDVIAVSN